MFPCLDNPGAGRLLSDIEDTASDPPSRLCHPAPRSCPGGWDYVLLNCQRYDCDGWNVSSGCSDALIGHAPAVPPCTSRLFACDLQENAGICYKPCDAGWYSDGAALVRGHACGVPPRPCHPDWLDTHFSTNCVSPDSACRAAQMSTGGTLSAGELIAHWLASALAPGLPAADLVFRLPPAGGITPPTANVRMHHVLGSYLACTEGLTPEFIPILPQRAVKRFLGA